MKKKKNVRKHVNGNHAMTSCNRECQLKLYTLFSGTCEAFWWMNVLPVDESVQTFPILPSDGNTKSQRKDTNKTGACKFSG